MLEINRVREHKDTVIQRLQTRQMDNAAKAVAKLLAIDQQRRRVQVSLEAAQAELHQLTKQVAALLKEDKTAAVAAIRSQSQALKATIKKLDAELKTEEAALQHAFKTGM